MNDKVDANVSFVGEQRVATTRSNGGGTIPNL